MIVYYSVLFIGFFLIALILRFNRFSFYNLAEYSVSLLNQLLSDYSEELKVRKVQKSTTKLLISLIKLLLVGIVAIVTGGIPIFIYCYLTNTAYSDLVFFSFYSLLTISLGATIPFLIPIKKKSSSDYSELSQLLHRLALDNYAVGYKLFKQEVKKIEKRKLEKQQDFVIVTGLARAGTTSLLNNLSRIGIFSSLNYANMPFLMCPNMWAYFYKPKNNQQKERSHKDGIKIGFNSNEALEEYFFKLKAEDSYIKDGCLEEYAISHGDYEEYLDYQCLIKPDNKKIYLAKNNNFLLRYKSVRTYNQEFLMVILYRDPLSHASSLMEKHRDYTKLQQEDPFILDYMNWLAHHEFGENHKPFYFQDSEEIQQEEKEVLNYWLKAWINYYSYTLTIHHPKTLFINYDAYCKDPDKTISTILQKAGIEAEIPDYHSFHNPRKAEDAYSGDIYETARAIYEELNKR